MSNALTNCNIQSSGYRILAISDIKIGKRFRKNMGDMQELCSNIRQHGLIEPIVVDTTLNLIAGERRIRAFLKLGLTHIPAHFINELPELKRREIELDENIHRKAMEWHERDKLVAEIHRVKQSIYGATAQGVRVSDAAPGQKPWSQQDTATSLDMGVRSVYRSVAMDHALRVVPGLAQADTRREAERKVQRLIEDLERELVIRQIEAQKRVGDEIDRLILGDVCEELSKLDPSSVDCCIADPPYGVDVGDNVGWRQEPGFDDDPVSALALLRAVLKEVRRVLRPNGHLYLFFPIIYYSQVSAYLQQSAFIPDDIPLIWTKDQHGTVDWSKRFAPSYETLFFCSDGTRTLTQKRINIFVFPTDKVKEHPFQKPVQLLRELLELSTKSQEVVLDIFGGSGSASIAAKQLARHYIYIDNDLRSLDIAKENLARVQRGSHEPKKPGDIV